MTIGVVISTFGSDEWASRGRKLADYTVTHNSADEVLHVHSDSLASARNEGAGKIGTDHIIFLDADDRLQPQYCDILRENLVDDNLLYQPETLGWYKETDTYDKFSNFIEDRDMNVSNNLVIGTAITAKHFVGFDEKLDALEDWEFFLRMILNGAKVKQCPGMVYVVGVNQDSRNSPTGMHNRAYQEIRKRGYKVKDYAWKP